MTWCPESGLTAPEHRKWRRVHGLQPPLHPQQLAGWLTLVLFAAATFLVLVPALAEPIQPALLALLAGLFVLHLASHLTALLLDPADVPLRRRRSSAAVPEFDRSKHAHVIENGRCHLCNIETSGPRTKHCSVCNKCVARFDHHCKWLNHCVGGRNYAAFLVCVVSAVAACLIVVGVAIAELVLYHVNPTELAVWDHVPLFNTTLESPLVALLPLQDQVFLLIVGAVGLLAAVTAGLLLHLCLFHIYISVLGITTYEYIRNYRQFANGTRGSTSRNPSEPIYKISSSSSKFYERRSFNGGLDSSKVNPTHGNCFLSSSKSNGSSLANKLAETHVSMSETVGEVNSSGSASRSWWSCQKHRDGDEARAASIQMTRSKSDVLADKGHCSLRTVEAEYEIAKTALKRQNSLGSLKVTTDGSVRRSCHGCRYCEMLRESDHPAQSRLKSLWRRTVCSTPKDGSPSPTVRRNQVRPSTPLVTLQTFVPLRPPSSEATARTSSLPALPPPTRRQLQTVSLKELNDVLALAQHPRHPKRLTHPLRRPHRRKSTPQLRPTMSPTLSPIHESGLSNPSTPHMLDKAPRPKQGLWLTPEHRP